MDGGKIVGPREFTMVQTYGIIIQTYGISMVNISRCSSDEENIFVEVL